MKINDYSKMKQTLDWLSKRFVNQENGIIFDSNNSDNFEVIQNFIEICDRPLHTPIIYYQAFPEESAIQFLSTLAEELAAKLGIPELTLEKSLSEIIQQAGLKTVVIDHCHLHPLDTLQNLLEVFARCQVAVILVGVKPKMAIAQILDYPLIASWDKLVADDGCWTLPKLH